MFQALLEGVLQRILGEYVEAIDPKKLNLSVYSGVVDLQDLNLKKTLFSGLSVPVELVIGRIKRLFVRVPWNALSTKPVQIEIQGLQLLVEPLENSAWEEFAAQQNTFEILEKALIAHSLEVFQAMMRKEQDPSSAHAEEERGFIMNLTSKVVDNIQLSIQNIHVRFEDSKNYSEPLSLGLTMEKLDIETTNEFWESEFIDRTRQDNKNKPLQKIINLSKLGFYCNPKDLRSRQVSQIADKEEQFAQFEELFPIGRELSEQYKNSYVTRPISSLTKLKQLSEHHGGAALNPAGLGSESAPREPIYQIDLEIEEFTICILKSQFEALFKVVEYISDYQTFIDNFYNKRAIQLQKFYTRRDDYEKNKDHFCQALLDLVRKEIKGHPEGVGDEGAFEEDESAGNASATCLEVSEVYTSLVSYENQLKLKKWASKVIQDNFQDLLAHAEAHRQASEAENQSGMISYIGSSLSWLGAGASGAAGYLTSEQPVPEASASRDPGTPTKLEGPDAATGKHFESFTGRESSIQGFESFSAQGSVADDAEFEDALDCLPEELDHPGQPQEAAAWDQIEEQKAQAPSEELKSADEIHRLSVMLYNDFSGPSPKDLIHQLRTSRASDAEQDIPIFQGRFHLKKSQISLVNDSKIKDLSQPFGSGIKEDLEEGEAYFQNQEYNEVLMFSNGFSITYGHYDAQDLDVKHQVKIKASCKDAGVQIIQKFVRKEPENRRGSLGSSLTEEQAQPRIQTETHDVIYKMREKQHFADDDDLMTIDLLFGNQNIKESMISKLESTADFVDQELAFKFRPITSLYRVELTEFFFDFLDMKEGVTDEVKLRALEEYEKLREAITLQNVFENHNQITSRFKLRVELDSSQILLPIHAHSEGKAASKSRPSRSKRRDEVEEAWIINTGNMLITNEKSGSGSNQLGTCDEGYNPVNLDMTNISMVYTENLRTWQEAGASSTRQVLKDLHIGMMIMIRDEGYKKFENPTLKPLMKVKVAAEEIKLVFSPITYLHLVNLGACFRRPGAESEEAGQAKAKERIEIFKNASLVQVVNKRGSTLHYWYQCVAVFSGSYLYFYPIEDTKAVQAAAAFFRLRARRQSEDAGFVGGLGAARPSVRGFNRLNYDEYYLVKGCRKIQSLSEYRKEVTQRASTIQRGSDVLEAEGSLDSCSAGKQGAQPSPPGRPQSPDPSQSSNQIRMENSQHHQCILEFSSGQECQRFSQLVIERANQIDQVLGKHPVEDHYPQSRSEASMIPDEGAQGQQKGKENPLQVLGLCDVKFKRFEILLESASKLKLKSRCVDGKTRDVIVLSTQQPEQFNRKPGGQGPTKKNADFESLWAYSMSLQNFTLGYSYRLFDDDKAIGIKTLQIEDRSFDKRKDHQPRFPMLLKTSGSGAQSVGSPEQVINVAIKTQSIESPRFSSVLMENDIKIGRMHFNWNPVSFNRVVRFFRLLRYVEEVCAQERLNIQQSVKIKLGNLHHAGTPRDGLPDPLVRLAGEAADVSASVESRGQEQRGPGLASSPGDPSATGAQQPRAHGPHCGSRGSHRQNRGSNRADSLRGLDKCAHRATCIDDTTNMMSVKMHVEKIKFVCIHPQNDSFPVFTKKFDQLRIAYDSYQDHDSFEGQIGNFRVLDNTNYPRTLDPYKNYGSSEKIPRHQILGFKVDKDERAKGTRSNEESRASGAPREACVIKFEMILFHYPLDLSCPIQLAHGNRQYDKLVKLEMKQLQINHMQELMFRLNDYFFYQFIYAITDANPYLDIIERLEVETDPFAEVAAREQQAKERGRKQRASGGGHGQRSGSGEGESSSGREESEDGSQSRSSSGSESSLQSQEGSRQEGQEPHLPLQYTKKYESSISERSNESSSAEQARGSNRLGEGAPSEDQSDEEESNVDIPDEEDYGPTQQRQAGDKPEPTARASTEGQFDFKTNFADFDLKQYPLTTGLDVTMENPVIVLKDRPYFRGNIEVDLGQIRITSRLDHVPGKWKLVPEKKTYVNVIDIDMKSVRIDYNSKSYMITPPFDMLISIERINYSELLLDQFMSKGIDFEQFDKSDQLTIKSSAFEMNFTREVYTYFLKCLDLNIHYYDMLAPGYQLFTWNSQNFMQYLHIEEKQVEKFTNSSVKKRETSFVFPSFSIKINQDTDGTADSRLLAELILYDLQMDFAQYIDYRSDIILRSQTFYILFKEPDGQQFASPQNQADLQDPDFKSLIVGPIQSPRTLRTTRAFYNGSSLHRRPLNEAKPLHNLKPDSADFVVSIEQQPDGAKVIDVDMRGLKLFLKVDVLYVVSNFFTNSWPSYSSDATDKPTYFEPEYGNYPRFETVLNLNDCLICFEQMACNQHPVIHEHPCAEKPPPKKVGGGPAPAFGEGAEGFKQEELFAGAAKGGKHKGEGSASRSFFTKTVAFQGQLQYHLVREKANQIKEEILEQPRPEILQAAGSLGQQAGLVEQNLSTSRRLKTQQVHIIDFQPFFCDIKDLDEGGVPLEHIYKRQMISPFNLFWNKNEMTEALARQVRALRRQHEKLLSQCQDPGARQRLLEEERRSLMGDSNFRFFTESELNLDLAELQMSFNDLITLKAISMKFDLMNDDFEKYMDNWNDGQVAADEEAQRSRAAETKGRLSSGSDNDSGLAPPPRTRDGRPQKVGVSPSVLTKQGPQAQRKVVYEEGHRNKPLQDVGRGASARLGGGDIDARGTGDEDRPDWLSRGNPSSKPLAGPKPRDPGEEFQDSGLLERPRGDEGDAETGPGPQNRGIDQTQVVSHGLKLIIINDRDNNFLPVLSANFSHFNIQWDHNARQSCVWTDLNSSLNFFNVNIGVWEPFVERFGVKLMMNQEMQSNKQNVSLTINTPLNLNFTEKLLENLYESQNSWNLVNEKFEAFKVQYGIMLSRRMEGLEGDQVRGPFDPSDSLSEDLGALGGQRGPESKERRASLGNPGGLTPGGRFEENLEADPFSDSEEAAPLKHQIKHLILARDDPSADPNLNEEIITPYVIVNKTDMAFDVKRLYGRDRRDAAVENKRRYRQLLAEENEAEANLHKRKCLINHYRLEQGQIIDYMVDYNDDKFKLGSAGYQEEMADSHGQETQAQPLGDFPYGWGGGLAVPGTSDQRANIHSDSIGEYKSEFIKIQFDARSLDTKLSQENFQENREIKKIDLNELGYRTHILREGKHMEKLFYGVKLIDFKKVFTIRTQSLLVNRTGYNYLVHLRFQDFSLLKFLESGDSLPLPMRYDKSKIQIKLVDATGTESGGGAGMVASPGARAAIMLRCQRTDRGRLRQAEETRERNVKDFRDPQLGYRNWSALIPLAILKERLNFDEGSYLTNCKSRFTFIRKTKAAYLQNDMIIDINLMPPLIVKNCLPFNLYLSFVDSSRVPQKMVFTRNEEKNLFCFSMAQTVHVDLFINGFEVKKQFKLFNLENYKCLEDKIELEDRYGRRTWIYTQISRQESGQRVVFYCKKVLVDQMDSQLFFLYKQPLGRSTEGGEYVRQMIPFVEQPDLRQRLYVIPEGSSEIWTCLAGESEKSAKRMDIETPNMQAEFKVSNQHQSFNYCYQTSVYLATPNEYIYTKITTLNPFCIFVNQSNYNILIEQAEMPHSTSTLDYQLPLVLGPNQRQAFNFFNLNPRVPGIDEFIHIKLMDEEISGRDLEELVQEKQMATTSESASSSTNQSFLGRPPQPPYGQGLHYGLPMKQHMLFTKQYNWSSPFMISEVDQFTLKVHPHVRKQRLQEQMNGLNLQERMLLTKIMNEPKYLKVKCKADLKQAPGSMFIIIDEEEEETCQYKIMNLSKNIEIVYSQHIVNNPLWDESLCFHDRLTQKCKAGQVNRFTWDSVLHQKILRVSFCARGQSTEETDKLELCNLGKDQEFRVIPTADRRFTDILIPFDKIGHQEDIELLQAIDMTNLLGVKGQMPSFVHQLNISVVTNGYTKFLRLTDVDENSKQKERSRDIDPSSTLTNYSLANDDQVLEAKMKILELSISQVFFSFIHKKSELMTIFVSKLHTHITETEQVKNIKFSIGYLQIDNQTESEPVYPVLLRPRDLHYNAADESIVLRLKEETEKERQEREAQGLAALTSDDAKMFQFNMVINNRSSTMTSNKDVLYIESIMFLLQTLVIKIQFTHFLKLTNFAEHIGKILNRSVNEVHYIFGNSEPTSPNDRGEFLDQYSLSAIAEGRESMSSFSLKSRDAQRQQTPGSSSKEALAQSSPGQPTVRHGSIKKKRIIDQKAVSGHKPKETEVEHLRQSLMIQNEEVALKKQDRLKSFARQDVLMSGCAISQHRREKIEAVMMSAAENNWQMANDVNIANEWRLFIREYQSSPTELFVSAINERLDKQGGKGPTLDSNLNDDAQIRRILENRESNGDPEVDETIQEDGVVKILGALGEKIVRKILFFSSFEDMQFQMNGLNISNLFGEGNEVMNQLANFHKETFKFSALRLLGSSNLIGNPSRFVSNIGTGVSDFFVKPYQGVKDGGIVNMRAGFLAGSRSLIQNSLMAPVGAMAKIGQSISRGTLALSYDDQFIAAKNFEERRNKPKSAGDGMKKGFASAKASIYSGISDALTKPVQGARAGGLYGFVAGGARGAAGLVTKTISGGMDIIAKTSEGLDNQSKGTYQLELAHRIRRPRPFYEVHSIIRPYNEFHSFWVTMVPQVKAQLDISHLYDVFQVDEEPKQICGHDEPPVRSASARQTPKCVIQESRSSIFVIAKNLIVEIESTIRMPEGEEAAMAKPSTAQSSLRIENVFQIKHVDFIEVVGEENNIMIIGFRQSQRGPELEGARPQAGATRGGPDYSQRSSGPLYHGYQAAPSLGGPENSHTFRGRHPTYGESPQTEDELERDSAFRAAVSSGFLAAHPDAPLALRQSTPQSLEASRSHGRFDRGTFTEKELEEIFSDARRGSGGIGGSSHAYSGNLGQQSVHGVRPPGQPYTGETFAGGSKRTQHQMNLLKAKLCEQAQLKSHSRFRVQSSPFHLQIEFENAQKAKETKAILWRAKAVLRKEKAWEDMIRAAGVQSQPKLKAIENTKKP